jgi:signal peptidase I
VAAISDFPRQLIAFISIIIIAYITSLVQAAEQKTYTVSGDSMSPALANGDSVDVESESAQSLKRGDLLALRIGPDRTPMVKRVVAVAGDKVEFIDGAVWVNGKKLGGFDARRWQATVKQLERSNWIVPPGYLFILGDNPANSRDSKRLGLIAITQVEGRVVRIVKKAE